MISWQFFLAWHLLLSTLAELLRRKLGQAIPRYNRVVNAFFFLCIHYPVGLATAHVIGFNFYIGWANLLILFIAGITFPLSGIWAFRASKDVDAGLFGILNNLNPVVTIILAGLLLAERLSPPQSIGASIILASTLVISTLSYKHGSRRTQAGIMLAIATVSLMGIQTVYETWMLERIGLGSYLVYGWGLQTFWMVLFAWPQRKKIGKVLNRRYGLEVLTLSVARSLKGLTFFAALYMSKSASIVSVFSSFLPILVVGTGVLFLGEKAHLKAKIYTALIGTAGLLILSFS